jgi:hypothetical protein
MLVKFDLLCRLCREAAYPAQTSEMPGDIVVCGMCGLAYGLDADANPVALTLEQWDKLEQAIH